jgi:hypothetical protein
MCLTLFRTSLSDKPPSCSRDTASVSTFPPLARLASIEGGSQCAFDLATGSALGPESVPCRDCGWWLSQSVPQTPEFASRVVESEGFSSDRRLGMVLDNGADPKIGKSSSEWKCGSIYADVTRGALRRPHAGLGLSRLT